jgi:hypothetical protein
MLIHDINGLASAIDTLSEPAKSDVEDFIEAIMVSDKINELLPMYDDLLLSGNTFTYVIKQNYQHVVFAVLGEINDSNEVIVLTLESYD